VVEVNLLPLSGAETIIYC